MAHTLQPAGELRALLMFDMLPPGCIPFPVADDASAPHLRLGEFAVVDTTDRDPIRGELFLIEWTSGRRSIVQTVQRPIHTDLNAAPVPAWFAASLNRPHSPEEVHRWIREGQPVRTIEGPFREGMIE